jgi:hypothetical protein
MNWKECGRESGHDPIKNTFQQLPFRTDKQYDKTLSRHLVLDLNLGPLTYEARVLSPQVLHSVFFFLSTKTQKEYNSSKSIFKYSVLPI